MDIPIEENYLEKSYSTDLAEEYKFMIKMEIIEMCKIASGKSIVVE